MITYRQGNLLDAEVEAVVNTVNTVAGARKLRIFNDRLLGLALERLSS